MARGRSLYPVFSGLGSPKRLISRYAWWVNFVLRVESGSIRVVGQWLTNRRPAVEKQREGSGVLL